MRRLFRWALYLFIIVVVLVVAGVLLLDTIAKEYLQSRLRAETGMDVKIGKMDIGLSTPTIDIENVRFYNTPEFGGSPFLDIPEVFIEYDKDAARARKIHLKLLRVNFAEIDLVQDQMGRLNLQSLQKKALAAKTTGTNSSSSLKFTGIDTVNLTVQKMRLSQLDAPTPGPEINLGLKNQIFHNINTEADWTQMGIILAARANGAAQSGKNSADVQKLIQVFVH
jgi:AsmA family